MLDAFAPSTLASDLIATAFLQEQVLDVLNEAVLQYEFLDTTLATWGLFFAVVAVVSGALRVANQFLIRRFGKRAAKTANEFDDYAVEILRGTQTFFLVAVGIWVATQVTNIVPWLETHAWQVVVVLLVVQSVVWFNRVFALFLKKYRERNLEGNPAAVTSMQAVGFVGRIIVYTVAFLLILANLGVEVTALVASLGIGGIAVALAAQNLLSDLFAALSIVLDKPFVVGDMLSVGEFIGAVEKVGLKTTRLRSLSGEQLIFSNADLVQSRVRNFKRMEERRIVFSFGVVYQTTAAQLEAIPEWIRALVEETPNARFDRAHFKQFGASSLDFEVVYYVTTPDFAVYMDRQQAINLALVRRFEEEGIHFAYPTQTLYLHGNGRANSPTVHTEVVRTSA
ncbi:MAG: mechanosensitive ion channel family protein [Bacteroidota bacterium]